MYFVISFIIGMSIMILELAGIKIISSYISNTNIVCSSIIGIMMMSLSTGYFIGGKLSKYKPNDKKLALFIFVTALYMFGLILFQTPFMKYVCLFGTSNIIKSLLSSVILFSFPTVLLGILSPYIMQLCINKEKEYTNAGSITGKLSSVSTIGAIFGTFIGGFFFNVYFGFNVICYVLFFIFNFCAILCILPRK